MKKRVYLCGPISGLTIKEAEFKRGQVEDLFSDSMIEIVNPMRGKYHINGDEPISPKGFHSKAFNDKSIIKRDRYDVTTSDLIFADFRDSTRVSIGSMVEFGWADIKNIPVVTVMHENDFHDHAFVHEISTHVVNNVEDAIYLSKLLLNL
jgi:nucleoside 2-deoxyribosyltransferase